MLFRSPEGRFPALALEAAGYSSLWHGQAQWNGVAILSRAGALREMRRGLPGGDGDPHSRYIEAQVAGITVASLYIPNGNPAPGPKFAYKLAWLQRLREHAASLVASGTAAVLAGDYNIIPTDLDVYAPERWREDALFRPEVRAVFHALLDDGWVDGLRTRYPGEPVYTFWKYWRGAFERNSGLRIDHLLLSPSLAQRLVGAGVDRDIRGSARPSDHAPAWIELRDDGP